MDLIGDRVSRMINGNVCFVVREGFPSLFLRECRKQGLRLRNVIISADEVKAQTSDRDYKRILSIASSLGMRVELLSKRGLPQLVRFCRCRLGIPIGILLFSVLLAIASSFVWSVEVEGLNALDPAAFNEYLRANQVCKGMFLCNVDTYEIEALAERYDPLVKKADVNIVGSRLMIRVLERAQPPNIVEERRACDLIAERGGEVIDADILAGTKKIKEGDAVVAGDVLAEGLIPLADGSSMPTRAQGTVMARTHRLLSCMSAQNLQVWGIKKWKKNSALCFFACEFPIFSENKGSADAAVHTTESVFYLRSGDHAFPLGIKKIGMLYLAEKELPLNKDQSLLLCATDLAMQFCEKLSLIKVVSFKETLTNAQTVTLEADYVCEENIAKQSE